MSIANIYPEVYTWVNQGTPATIAYSGANVAYQGGYVMAGFGSLDGEWNYLGDANGWVRFNLSSIPAGSTIDSVQIRFDIVWEDSFGAGWNGYIGDMWLHRSTNITWDDSTLTWNNAPSVDASYSGLLNWNCNANEQGSARSQQTSTKVVELSTADIVSSLSAGKISYRFNTNGVLWSMNYDGIVLDVNYTAGDASIGGDITLPISDITTDQIKNLLNLTFSPITFQQLCQCPSVQYIGLNPSYCTGVDASARQSNLQSAPYEISKFRGYTQTTSKIIPTLTWANPGTQTYGYSIVQNAYAGGVAGTFTYDVTGIQGAGSVTSTATFHPTDTETYENHTTVSITFTINKKALTVTGTNNSRYYGDANPSLTVSYSGWVNGDGAGNLITQPTATCSANSTTPAGTANIVPSGGVSSNYSFTYVNGTLTINKAVLTVTANSPSKTYGNANPSFSIASYSGWKNSETTSVLTTLPTASCSATQYSNVGNYNVVPANGVDENYSFNYVNGTMSIGKRTPTIVWSNPPPQLYIDRALSSTQLNATIAAADVAIGCTGSFVYDPCAGTYYGTSGWKPVYGYFTSTSSNWNNNQQQVNVYVQDQLPVQIRIRPAEGWPIIWWVGGYLDIMVGSSVHQRIYMPDQWNNLDYPEMYVSGSVPIYSSYWLNFMMYPWYTNYDSEEWYSMPFYWDVNDYEVYGTSGFNTGTYAATSNYGQSWTIEHRLYAM